ncbi:MAG TPA: hypothetical protein DC049_03925 [Spirochaetia bacterium]|nr:hypothetical protein [Spirochaetia bacterium]
MHIFDERLFASLGPDYMAEKSSSIAYSVDNGMTWTLLFDGYNTLCRRSSLIDFQNRLYFIQSVSDNPEPLYYMPLEIRPGSDTIYHRSDLNTSNIMPGMPYIDPIGNYQHYALIIRYIEYSNSLFYIGGYVHNFSKMYNFGLFRATSFLPGDIHAYQITTSRNDIPWDIITDTHYIYVLLSDRTAINPDSFIVKVYRSGNTVNFTELFRFTAGTFARSFEIINGDFYVAMGTDVGTNSTNSIPDHLTYTSTMHADAGKVYRIKKTLYNQLPAVSVTAPTNNAMTTGHTVSITANAADCDDSVKHVEFVINSIKISEDTAAPYFCVVSNLSEGYYTIVAKAVDYYNCTNTSSDVHITVDNTTPQFTASSPTNNEENIGRYSSVSIFFSETMAADISSNIILSNYNNGAVISGAWNQNNGSNLLFTPGAAMGGANERIIVSIAGNVKDLAGNNLFGDTNFCFTLLADTPPVVSINSPDNLAFLNAGMMISGTSSDIEDNIVYNKYTYDNWATIHITETLSNWSVSACLLPDGTNLFQIKAYDTAGEASAVYSRYFIIDKTAPGISLPQGFTTNLFFETKTNFTIGFNDINLVNYSYRYSTGEFITVTDSSSLALSFDKSGVYSLDIKARDKAGNENRMGLALTFDISLVDLAGLSEKARRWARKIRDEKIAGELTDIKFRKNGIPVIEYLAKKTGENRGSAATIVSRKNDNVLIICKHENGITKDQPKKVTVYDRSGKLIRQIDPAGIRDTVLVWDKKDMYGRLASDGIYFLIVEYTGSRNTIPVVIIGKVR